MYALLLRHALESEPPTPGSPEALERELQVLRRAIGADRSRGARHTDRLADWIEHDALLVRICAARGIPEHLTDPNGGPVEPERERLLAALEEAEVNR